MQQQVQLVSQSQQKDKQRAARVLFKSSCGSIGLVADKSTNKLILCLVFSFLLFFHEIFILVQGNDEYKAYRGLRGLRLLRSLYESLLLAV